MKLDDLARTTNVKLNIADIEKLEAAPETLSIVTLNKEGEPIDTQEVKVGGDLKLDPQILKSADRVLVLTAGSELNDKARANALTLSPEQLVGMVELDIGLTLSPERLMPIFPFIRCLNGSVRKCWWWPFFEAAFANQQVLSRDIRPELDVAALRPNPLPAVAVAQIGSFLPPFLRRCRPVCIGRIEIYRRRCCRRDILVPNDILAICERLKRLPDRIPDLTPPLPGPDPVPFQELPFFIDGAADENALNAQSDLQFLQSAPFEEAQKFVVQTPRLARWIYDCTVPTQVAEGQVGPDGEFTICFQEFPIFLPSNCHFEYAFKVIQPQQDGTGEITVYNGVSSNQWFEPGDDISLTTYHPSAIDCDDDDPRHTSPDVMLDLIGQTEGWHLNRIAQNGSDSVLPLGSFTGLAGVAGNTDFGGSDNSNWGATLQIKYFFPDALKATGARYYRISVTPVNDLGQPDVANRVYLNQAISWNYYNPVLGQVEQFPLNLPGQPSFYRIPYRDEQWLGNQFHGILNTAATTGIASHGKHIMMLEMYDDNGGVPGNRLVPNGSGDQATGDVEANFDYAWIKRPGTGPLPNIPWAALSHVLWWDNRKATAEIEATLLNGTSDTDECQFLQGNAADTFGAAIRAFHDDPLFIRSWRLDWRRGLNGTSAEFDSGTMNVGDGPMAHSSATTTVQQMLAVPGVAPDHEKCAFSINLWVRTKTWNGIGYVNATDNHDQAAFALENLSA